MEDYKKLLTDLYTAHDPERLKQIDYFLERYKGKEKQFYISQKAKYKNKKPVSDSKKIIEEALARIKSQSDSKAKQAGKHQKTDSSPNVEGDSRKPKEVIQEKQEEIKAVEEEKQEVKAILESAETLSKTKVEEEKKASKISPVSQAIQEVSIPEKEDPEIDKAVKPIENEKVNQKETAKPEVWFSEEEKTKNFQKQNNPPHKTQKTSNKKYFFYIFGIVILFIILALLLFFLFFSKPHTTKKASPKPKTTLTKKTPKAKPVSTKTKIQKKTNTKKISPQKVQPKTTTKANAVRIRKGSIDLPAYFVACYAVKSETLALKKIAELKAKGFNACYYWIQDFDTYGNPYFKVAIGPFSNRLDAMKKLTPVQEKAEFDAYVLELK
jgi:chemotaxis protein histidine kinase CheA